MKKQVELIEWLDERGYGLFRYIQVDGSEGEYILARAIIEDGALIVWENIMESSHKPKCVKRWQHELVINKDVIMDIRETLEGLTIQQLESLLPSYYQLAIERRIEELKNAVTKTKRSREETVTNTD